MLTLSNGYYQPEDDDTGDVFWDALAANWARVNSHSHDGTDSEVLTATTQSVSAGSWSADLGGGKYRQLITMPTGLAFDTCAVQCRLASGHIIYPTIEKVSSNTFYLYVNDNTLGLTVVYTS